MSLHDISIHINFDQKQSINECADDFRLKGSYMTLDESYFIL